MGKDLCSERSKQTCKQATVAEGGAVLQGGSSDHSEQRLGHTARFQHYTRGGCGLNLSPDIVVDLF